LLLGWSFGSNGQKYTGKKRRKQNNSKGKLLYLVQMKCDESCLVVVVARMKMNEKAIPIGEDEINNKKTKSFLPPKTIRTIECMELSSSTFLTRSKKKAFPPPLMGLPSNDFSPIKWEAAD
jgi:hypothetical protein